MASGELGPVIESAILDLADDGQNEAGNLLFKVAANIYLLVYRGLAGNDMRFATFSINDATGDVDPTIIAELSVLGVYSTFDKFQDIVIQIPGTRIWVTGTASGGTVAVRTLTCDSDGTNLAVVATQNFTGFSTTFVPFFHFIAPNVIGVVAGSGGVNGRLATLDISDTGVINATPIQGPTAIAAATVNGFAQVRNNIGLVTNNSGAVNAFSFELNLDGTFDPTVLDTELIWTRTVSASQLNSISKSDGIAEWSGWSQNFSNRIERYHRVTVDASGIITDVLNFESQNAAVNKYRPTTFAIGDGVYVFLNEGSNIIRTIDTLGLGVSDTEAVPVVAGTKGVAFAVVSPTIGAMAHIGTNALGVVQYITTYSLVNTFGAVASPVAISAQVAMQQRELLLF